uniref:Uncharacterized protein n=1 Tax=Naja naja TaxID=35670 RepID=A0A8C6XKE4_NAJNA
STEKKRVVDLGSATPPTGGLDEVEDAHIQEDNQDDDNVEENSSNHFRKKGNVSADISLLGLPVKEDPV